MASRSTAPDGRSADCNNFLSQGLALSDTQSYVIGKLGLMRESVEVFCKIFRFRLVYNTQMARQTCKWSSDTFRNLQGSQEKLLSSFSKTYVASVKFYGSLCSRICESKVTDDRKGEAPEVGKWKVRRRGMVGLAILELADVRGHSSLHWRYVFATGVCCQENSNYTWIQGSRDVTLNDKAIAVNI